MPIAVRTEFSRLLRRRVPCPAGWERSWVECRGIPVWQPRGALVLGRGPREFSPVCWWGGAQRLILCDVLSCLQAVVVKYLRLVQYTEIIFNQQLLRNWQWKAYKLESKALISLSESLFPRIKGFEEEQYCLHVMCGNVCVEACDFSHVFPVTQIPKLMNLFTSTFPQRLFSFSSCDTYLFLFSSLGRPAWAKM